MGVEEQRDDRTRSRCLLVVPRSFYSFARHLRTALEAKGFEVSVANDEYPEGLLGKIVGKLQIPTVRLTTHRVFVARHISDGPYNLVLIVKGRGMSARLIARLREHGARIIGYNWDSFRLNRAPLRWMRHADRYATFDYRDADAWGLPLVELFSANPTRLENKAVEYEFSAIFRNHSGRLAYLHEVLSILGEQSIYVRIFELNLLTLIYNSLRHPLLVWRYRRYISFAPVPYDEYSRVMAASRFTIDYAHDTQTGITMRCFEAVNSRTKIITNNPYMARSPNFAATDFVIHCARDPASRLRATVARAAAVPFASTPRTISDFIDELLAAPSTAAKKEHTAWQESSSRVAQDS